jgi:nitrate/nitrite transporter NarK
MYNEEQLEMITSSPSWVTAVFAIAVFGGIFGSIALLLRKKIARILFIISLIGILAQMYHNLFVIDSVALFGSEAVIMPIMILVFAVFLLWYSKFADKKNWLS